ncbi:MAG: UvrD-helicase domain-containing protein [Vulcanimicrobiota bacterium]
MRLADQSARDCIQNDLGSTLVVEAAAGTGKTTVLVERILSLFREQRCQPGGLAALTFTEKAAGEMKLRIRERLEKARLDHPALEQTLVHLEEAQITTFHSFCATCLQEYPVEAGVDVDFETLDQDESLRLFGQTFQLWLQQKLEDPPEGIRRYMRRLKGGYQVRAAGERLESMAWTLACWREFRCPWEGIEVDRELRTRGLIEKLEELQAMRKGASDRNHNYVKDTWALEWFLTRLQQRKSVNAEPDLDGLEAGLAWLANQSDFKKPKKGRGKDFGPNLSRQEMLAEHELVLSELTEFVSRCDAHLVSLLQQELFEAVDAYQQAKRRQGALDFLDLLLATRHLMAESPRARQALQQRYSHIFVDEFQDTDPLQAEILFLLAAQDPEETDWKKVEINPGKLFVVGDPKQSIYRFRRADVGTYFKTLERLGSPLELTTSFRSVPSIQSFVNSAFIKVMTGDIQTLQAHHVALNPYRPEEPSQPSVVALRVPVTKLTKQEVQAQTPIVIASYLKWMLTDSGWTVGEEDGARRALEARDVCILFRQMQSWGEDLTRPYIDELQGRGIESLVVGGRSYHSREEVSTLVTALEAIEWPHDELAVFATLRGPLFAVEESLLYQYRLQHRRLNMLAPAPAEERFSAITEALEFLARLHRRRNRCPIAETVAALLEHTRYYAALVLRPRGEQALANALSLVERARQYDARDNLSFRGFVNTLVQEARDDVRAEAPILEQTSDGVRLMTVHASKGLEFPVVILAVPGAPLIQEKPGRHLDPDRDLCLLRLGQLVPQQLADVEQEELAIERAEGQRLCYVAATRARDLLVFPGFELTDRTPDWLGKSWLSPLWGALDGYHCEAPYHGPLPQMRDFSTLPYVWFASTRLNLKKHATAGVRQDEVLVDLITKEVDPEVVEEGRRGFQEWERAKEEALQNAALPTIVIRGPKEAGTSVEKVRVGRVERESGRPVGPRFGSLIHAVLENLSLQASTDEVSEMVHRQGRIYGAPEVELAAAELAIVRALSHPVLVRARHAAVCLRESPLNYRREDGTLVSGIVDLAFKDSDGWAVVDFKTDEALPGYLRQVGAYVEGVEALTGEPTEGWVLLV